MRILKFYLPGIVLASTGFIIYTTLQTKSNYYLLHSIWHICMAISIVFFLPDRISTKKSNKKMQTKTCSSISSQTSTSTTTTNGN